MIRGPAGGEEPGGAVEEPGGADLDGTGPTTGTTALIAFASASRA
jgi:hypothetical protein